MNVTMTMKEIAIGRILRRHDVTSENSRMGLTTLKQEWALTGLRTSDLADVLSEYVWRGVLIHEQYDQEKGVMLTGSGVNYLAASSRRLKDVASAALAKLSLRKKAARTRSLHSQSLNRRSTD